MKVLLIGTYLNKGGASHSMRKLGEALKSQGNSVGYFTVSSIPLGKTVILFLKVVDRLLFYRNKPKMTNPLKNIYVELFLRRIAKGYDTVIFNWIGDGFLHPSQITIQGKHSTYLNILDEIYFNNGCHYSLGCKNCINNISKCPSIRFKIFESPYLSMYKRQSIKLSDYPIKFIAHNEMYYKRMQDLWPKAEIVKIGMPFDEGLIADSFISKEYHRTQVGFISPQISNPRKGFDDFLNIVELALDKDLDFEWLTAGKGNVLDSRVNHLGYLSGHDLRDFYSRLDILVFTSKQENLSNVLLNAVANGVYVVCFDVGGNRDIVCQDDYGRVFNKHEITEVVSHLGNIELRKLRQERNCRARRFRDEWRLRIETEIKAEF